MKTRFRFLVSTLLLTLGLLLAARPAFAQVIATNDVPNPWPTVTAGVASNVVSWANSGGYTAGNSLRLQTTALGQRFTWSFSCATVTLATATAVLQLSPDNATWANVPNGQGSCVTITVPASAASANNTNVVFSTNVSQATIGNNLYARLASVTNGNAASITGSRLIVSPP